jgi:uncharacterized protein
MQWFPFRSLARAFEPSAGGHLVWRRTDALLVADLHLEKASWFALRAIAPALRFACDADRARRRGRSERSAAALLPRRQLPRPLRLRPARSSGRGRCCGLTSRLDWTWIVGNHDPGFADHCGGAIVEEVEVGGILLRHEADPTSRSPKSPAISIPSLRLNVNGRRISRRCFVASRPQAHPPAFGALTGGLDARHPEIVRPSAETRWRWCRSPTGLLRFPIAA